MSTQSPPPSSNQPHQAAPSTQFLLFNPTLLLKISRFPATPYWAFLVLGLSAASLLVMLRHPYSPFFLALDNITGGADIAEQDLELPPPPQQIQPTMTPLVPLAAHEQPTLLSPLQGFCHPLWGQGHLSQGIRGVTHNGRMEYAYDYATGIGTPIYAMRSGRIISLQDKYPDWGGNQEQIHRFNHVWIEHEGGYRSAYVHLQQGFRERVNLKVGDQVKAGQIIGYSGNSGWSSGPHLHVEVHRSEERFRFTQTVPFAISSDCSLGRQATNLATKLPTAVDSPLPEGGDFD